MSLPRNHAAVVVLASPALALHLPLHRERLAAARLPVREDAHAVPVHHALQQRLYLLEHPPLRRLQVEYLVVSCTCSFRALP
eukprot:3172337-Rhodomonas_salina.1